MRKSNGTEAAGLRVLMVHCDFLYILKVKQHIHTACCFWPTAVGLVVAGGSDIKKEQWHTGCRTEGANGAL